MQEFITVIFSLACIALPFIAMPLLWRRMKRVRDQAYREAKAPPREQAWEESLGQRDGLTLGRAGNPNDDLIALGGKARETRWPVDNP